MTLPYVPAGTELHLPAGAWRQGEHGGRARLDIRVARTMPEVPAPTGEVWVCGTRLDGTGRWAGQIHALVRVDALPRTRGWAPCMPPPVDLQRAHASQGLRMSAPGHLALK